MTKLRFLSLTIGVLILTDLSCWRPAIGADETLRKQVDQLAQPYLDNKLIIGMTIGVLHDGKQEVFGYGQMNGNDPRVPDGDTIYEIGGICKVMTGILLADAVIQGHVRLDQPAEELLPAGVKMPSKGDRPITLMDLSTHTSGLPKIPDNMKIADLQNPYANYSDKDLYAFLNKHRLRRAPGTQISYSNLGAGLLGYLLSQREHTSYEQLVRDRIATPLGMSSTKVTIDQDMQSRFAPGHRDGKPAANWDMPILAGAGSLRSTVNDMLLFAAANLTPREDILGKAMEMAWTIHQLPIEKKDPAIGLGWHLMADGTHWHNGQTGGYHCMLLIDRRSKSSVVVMANTATRHADELATDIMKTLSGKRLPQRKFEKPTQTTAEDLLKFVGRYELAPDSLLTVDETDGKLTARLPGQPALPIAPFLGNVWNVKGIQATILFNVDQQGKCDSLILYQNDAKQTAKRVQATMSPPSTKATTSLPDGNMMFDNWAGALIIASIVFAFAIYHTSTAWFAHRERMALIERGIDPDSGQPVQE